MSIPLQSNIHTLKERFHVDPYFYAHISEPILPCPYLGKLRWVLRGRKTQSIRSKTRRKVQKADYFGLGILAARARGSEAQPSQMIILKVWIQVF